MDEGDDGSFISGGSFDALAGEDDDEDDDEDEDEDDIAAEEEAIGQAGEGLSRWQPSQWSQNEILARNRGRKAIDQMLWNGNSVARREVVVLSIVIPSHRHGYTTGQASD